MSDKQDKTVTLESHVALTLKNMAERIALM